MAMVRRGRKGLGGAGAAACHGWPRRILHV